MEKKELKFLILLFYYNRPKMVLNALTSINKLLMKNPNKYILVMCGI